MRSARWLSARNFCARGVPDFQKFIVICKIIFARFFAQILRHLDAGLARILALERMSIQKRAATKGESLRNHARRVHAVFMRAAPRIFSETSQIFRAIWAQNLLDADAGRLTFSNLDAMRLRSTLSDVVQHAQRTLAECMQFFCAGRAAFPKILQNFRQIFAQILRDLDAGLAHNPA